jgi:hypothetical protein
MLSFLRGNPGALAAGYDECMVGYGGCQWLAEILRDANHCDLQCGAAKRVVKEYS